MAGPDPDDVLQFEDFRLDRQAGGLFRVGESGNANLVPLGSRALDLLALLVRRNGETVTKEEMMTVVWSGRAVEDANLNVQVSKLRHILDQGRSHGSCIQTVTGYGYRFIADVTQIGRSARSCSVLPTGNASNGLLNSMQAGIASEADLPDDQSEFCDDANRKIPARPSLVARSGNAPIDSGASHDPAIIDAGSFLIGMLGTSGAIDQGLTAALLDMRRRLIDDYGDGAAAMLLAEQVIAGYQEFIRVTGWVASLSTTVEHELFDSEPSAPRPPGRDDSGRDGSFATSAAGQHLAQLHEGVVPLVEQYASAMRNALAALETLRIPPAKE